MRSFLRKLLMSIAIFAGVAPSAWSVTIDLVDAYQAAVKNDPIFRAARAQYLSSKEATPQARAALLPQLSVNGQIDSQEQGDNQGDEITIQATQVIFDWSAFMQLREARSTVRAAAELFASEEQDLILRLVSAYFRVVAAQDIYHASVDLVNNAKTTLEATRTRFKHGHATITDIDQATASYDSALVTTLRAKIEEYTSLQDLSRITGERYKHVAGLRFAFSLITPNPKDEEHWVSKAKIGNLFLKSTEETAEAAKRTISVRRGDFAPAIRAFASYQPQGVETGTEVFPDTSKFNYGLELDYNAFEGLLRFSQLRQAKADYERALAEREQAYLSAVAEARASYNAIVVGKDQLHAARLSIVSSRSALKHTQQAYMAGVKTILDVLAQQEVLFQSQRAYAEERRTYIENIARLEIASGILSPKTVRSIDRWLDVKRKRHSIHPLDLPALKDYRSVKLKSSHKNRYVRRWHRTKASLLRQKAIRQTKKTKAKHSRKIVQPELKSNAIQLPKPSRLSTVSKQSQLMRLPKSTRLMSLPGPVATKRKKM